MRIGIASEWIGERVGGLERYAVNLIRALVRIDRENTYEIFVTSRGGRELASLESERVAVRRTRLSSRWYYLPVGLPLCALRHPVDFLHATFSLAPWTRAPSVILTVHDVGPDAHPEFFPAGARRRFRWLMARGVSRAARIIVPSEATRRELVRFYPAAAGKVVVIAEGVDHVGAGAAGGSGGAEPGAEAGPRAEMILYVGRFHARKNLERLIHAFALLRDRRGRSVRLVLAGRDLWSGRRLGDLARALGVEGAVTFLDGVDDDGLGRLYREASVFAFPSLHEGFGIAPLEAMAHGVPVMASRASAMPEVLGDAALLVDPCDVPGMAGGLERLLSEARLRRELAERGRERVLRFSWESAARATLGVYEEVARESRSAVERAAGAG